MYIYTHCCLKISSLCMENLKTLAICKASVLLWSRSGPLSHVQLLTMMLNHELSMV